MLYLFIIQVLLYGLFVLATRNLIAYSDNLESWCKVRTSVETYITTFILQVIPIIGILLWFTHIRTLYSQFRDLIYAKKLKATGENWLVTIIKKRHD